MYIVLASVALKPLFEGRRRREKWVKNSKRTSKYEEEEAKQQQPGMHS